MKDRSRWILLGLLGILCFVRLACDSSEPESADQGNEGITSGSQLESSQKLAEAPAPKSQEKIPPPVVTDRVAKRTGKIRNSGPEDRDSEIEKEIVTCFRDVEVTPTQRASVVALTLKTLHELRAKQQSLRKITQNTSDSTEIVIPPFTDPDVPTFGAYHEKVESILGAQQAKLFRRTGGPYLRKLFMSFGEVEVTLRYEHLQDGDGTLTISCGEVSQFSFSGRDIPIEYTDLIQLE